MKKKSALSDSKRQKKLEAFQKKVGYSFTDLSLLDLSLTHSSYANESFLKEDNERLEFLGDLVLGLVIGDHLLKQKPSYSEGRLSFIKSYLVSKITLALLGEEIGIGEILLLGKGERLSGGKKKTSLLADALEALIAAIYRDGGLESANQFILSIFKKEINTVFHQEEVRDYKSLFQEKSQKEYNVIPSYKVTDIEGPDHNKTFSVTVSIGGKMLGKGKGKTKKAAEQAAASVALNLESN